MMRARIRPAGEAALLIELGEAIGRETYLRVQAADRALRRAAIPGLIETVPAYASLTVYFDPEKASFGEMRLRVEALLGSAREEDAPDGGTVRIPVLYGGEWGPDLAEVARRCGLSPREVIRRHAAGRYLVHMLGFTPGFPYLGGMDERLSTPRREAPRTRIPAGSVGIAGGQTGVYPIDSPGGWQIIGRTPLRLFDPGRASPFLLDAGQTLRFRPIGEREYRRIAAREAERKDGEGPARRGGVGVSGRGHLGEESAPLRLRNAAPAAQDDHGVEGARDEERGARHANESAAQRAGRDEGFPRSKNVAPTAQGVQGVGDAREKEGRAQRAGEGTAPRTGRGEGVSCSENAAPKAQGARGGGDARGSAAGSATPSGVFSPKRAGSGEGEPGRTGILVEDGGLFTTVQDAGRPGWQRYGVPVSGAADRRSYALANLLVGNAEGEAALECTLVGPRLRFLGPTAVAVCGGDLAPRLNGEMLPLCRCVEVRAGDELSFGPCRSGCRAYVAFAGGLDAMPVMGSRSTYTRAAFGGVEGRPLRAGDRLGFRLPYVRPAAPEERSAEPEAYPAEALLRVVLGPQQDRFSPEGIETFLSSPYAVTAEWDRMGCRLCGPAIRHRTDANILSDGIPPGAVQVPDSGQPIVMLADRQTLGGYAKIAAVISADLPLAAQAKAGDVLRFRAVSPEEAREACLADRRRLRELEARWARSEKEYWVQAEGKVFRMRVSPREGR